MYALMKWLSIYYPLHQKFLKKFLSKKFCSSKISCTFAFAFDKQRPLRQRDESETILENIPYRHSSTAVFFLLSARQEDCSNKKYTGTKIRTVKNSICQPLYTIESGQHQTDNTLLEWSNKNKNFTTKSLILAQDER